jgi:metallo-beta-lactamase family protein
MTFTSPSSSMKSSVPVAHALPHTIPDVTHNKPRVHFFGGTGAVTGANFLFEIAGKRFLIDCGLMQGEVDAQMRNYESFPYDPASIDTLFVTHAHADHVGRIPKLVKDGFLGKIYSTAPTRDIAFLILRDSASLMEEDFQRTGREPLYNNHDIEQAMSLWKVESYHHTLPLTEGLTVTMHDAGHILGSSMMKFAYHDMHIVFTGDLGNTPAPLLRDTEILTDVDYLIMESVYGNRNHEQREIRTEILEKIIEETIQRGGAVMIPSFAVERTQELLFELNHLIEEGHIPGNIPVYVDSPLAIHVTDVYRRSTELFNQATRDRINSGDDVFNFSGLTMTVKTEESKHINDIPGAKVIIAGSGMMDGGRILHHVRRYISDPNSTLLFVGYQAAGTLGRVILDGARYISVFGESLPVRCHIEVLSGYSGHKQMDDLVAFVGDIRERVKQVYCVMGEPASAMFLAQRLQDYVGVNATAPNYGDVAILE